MHFRLTTLKKWAVAFNMSWLKKNKSNPWMAIMAVLMAIVVFTLPQGICLKTMLTEGQCCSTSRVFAAMPVSDYVKPCCKAHASQDSNQEDSVPASEDEGCMWTSDDPYVLSSLDVSDIIVVNLTALPWDSLLAYETPMLAPNFESATKDLTSPALRRGSSILRI